MRLQHLLLFGFFFSAAGLAAELEGFHAYILLSSARERAQTLALKRRAQQCAQTLDDFLRPPPACHRRAAEVASKSGFRTARSETSMPNDLYAISSVQQTALVLYKACRSHAVEEEWRERRNLSLLTRASTVVEFLAEENARRRRWAERLARFVWFNYEDSAFPAPEMDPRTGRHARGEWSNEPMFVLDNLDTLHMLGLEGSLDRMVRWIELSTILVESISGKNNYLNFAQAFLANMKLANPASEERCSQGQLFERTSKWMNAATPQEVKDFTNALASYLDTCHPYAGPHKSNVNSKDLLNVIRSYPQYMAVFQSDETISFFEFTIRGFAGLLSAYQLNGHPVLMYKAWEVGYKMSYTMFSCHGLKSSDQSAHLRGGPDTFNVTKNPPCLPDRSVSWIAWTQSRPTSQNAGRTTPAVVGSNQLEYAALSHLTGICLYEDESQRILNWVLSETQMAQTGLVPQSFSIRVKADGIHLQGSSIFGIGAEIDSMYEYLIKSAYQSHSEERNKIQMTSAKRLAQVFPSFLDSTSNMTDEMYLKGLRTNSAYPPNQEHGNAAGTLLLGTRESPLTFQNSLAVTGGMTHTKILRTPDHTHLGCYSAGMVHLMATLPVISNATARQLHRYGEEIAEGCAAMYLASVTGLGAEATQVDTKQLTLTPLPPTSKIRPEVLEGITYQHHATGKQKYRNLAWKFLDATMANARVLLGICSVDNASEFPAQYYQCRQDTWVLGETLKYYLLIFSSGNKIKNELMRPKQNLTALQESAQKAVQVVMQTQPPTKATTPLEMIRDQLYGHDFAQLTNLKFAAAKDVNKPPSSRTSFIPRLDSTEFGDIEEHNRPRDETVHPLLDGFVLNTEAHPLLGLPSYPCAAHLKTGET